MNRLVAALAVSSLALSGSAAEAAKKKPRSSARVFDAVLAPLAASGVTGRAQAVDNKKSDSAKIQLKGLKAGGSYSWTIVRVKGTGDACAPEAAGEAVGTFTYRDLTGDAAGNAASTSKSKAFAALLDRRYAVLVSDEEGVPVACGELKRKKK